MSKRAKMTPTDALRHTQVIIALCTKLDAECDRQTTVVGRLLTTLGNDQRAVAPEVGEKLQRELRAPNLKSVVYVHPLRKYESQRKM